MNLRQQARGKPCMVRLHGSDGGATKSKTQLRRQSIPFDQLADALQYNPNSGVFNWKKRLSNCIHAGDVAGNLHRGYVRIRVFGQLFPAHELAWRFASGEWPKQEIDHINGIKSDNRICNLRDVSHAINGQNQRRARRDNKLGLLGVIAYGDGYAAKIMKNGNTTYLGKHRTPEKAHAAYLKAKRTMHEGCSI